MLVHNLFICFLNTFFLQVQEDLEAGIVGAIPIPSSDEGKEEVIAALVANVEAMIKADRKITALKQLQVRGRCMNNLACLLCYLNSDNKFSHRVIYGELDSRIMSWRV